MSMHCCFVMAHKPLITEGFVTVCCSMSAVSKTSCSHFSAQGSYYATHTLGLTHLHSVVMTRLNLWSLWVCAWFDGNSVSRLALSVMVCSCIGVELDSKGPLTANIRRLKFSMCAHFIWCTLSIWMEFKLANCACASGWSCLMNLNLHSISFAVSELPRAICRCIELLTLFQQEKFMYTVK